MFSQKLVKAIPNISFCSFLYFICIFIFFNNSIKSGELSYAGQSSGDASVIGNSSAGGSFSTVSLYTGQHTEIFPLISLPTQGLGEIAVSLSYSGNVSQAIKKENRRMPSSWVGLGFNLGTEYIGCDHKGTVSIDDDNYYFVGSAGQNFKLITIDPSTNIYSPSTGELWRLERNVATINGVKYVIGWTVIRNNGIKTIYGDNSTDFSIRNATWFQMHWGEYVIPGASNGDLPFPFRWDISKIERNATAFVSYEYEQVDEQLTVINGPSNLTDNYYTQASYTKKISSSNGYAVEFVLTDRLDFQDFYNTSQYEYYRKKKLSTIISSYNDHVNSHIRLEYDYFNASKDAIWKKLKLKSIQTFEASNTIGLPPIEFSYFTNQSSPYFGAMQYITYSEGGKKEIVYDQIDADNTLMSLNQGENTHFAEYPIYAYSSNALIRKYRLYGESVWKYDIGSFNGYWKWKTLEDITDSNGDSSITAGEGWVALYNHDINKYIIFEWNSGQWVRDTVALTWSEFDHNLNTSANPGGTITSDTYTTTADGFVTYSLKIHGEDDPGGGSGNPSPPAPQAPPTYSKIIVGGVQVDKIEGYGYQTISGRVDVLANQIVKVETYAYSTAQGSSTASSTINKTTELVNISASSNPGAPSESESYTTTATEVVNYSLSIQAQASGGSPTPPSGSGTQAPPTYARISVDGNIIDGVEGYGYKTSSGQITVGVNQVVEIQTLSRTGDPGPASGSASFFEDMQPSNEVKLVAGNGFFIAFDTKYETEDNIEKEYVRRGYLYKKTNEGWVEHFMFDQGDYLSLLGSVKLGSDLYAVQIEDGNPQEKSKLVYGKYNYQTKSLDKGASGWIDRLIYDVGVDLLTYGERKELNYASWLNIGPIKSTVYTSTYNNSEWNIISQTAYGLRALIALANGVVFVEGFNEVDGNGDHYDDDGFVQYRMRDLSSSGWVTGSIEIGFDPDISYPLTSDGNNSFLLLREHTTKDNTEKDVVIYEWNGVNWDTNELVSQCSNKLLIQLSTETAVAYGDSELFVRKRLGPNNWSTPLKLYNSFIARRERNPDHPNVPTSYSGSPAYVQIAGDFLIVAGYSEQTEIGVRNIHKWNSETNIWSTIDFTSYSSHPDYDDTKEFAVPILFNGRFYIRNYSGYPDWTSRGFYSFQEYNDTFFGIPTFSIVKQVKMYPEGDATTTPLVIDYSYDGGILDVSGNLPRFAVAKKSTPYFDGVGNSPNGYSISYFYNDLDNDDFNDPHGDGSLLLPDLNHESFGVPNGGFLLDGAVYMSYDSTVTSTTPVIPHDRAYSHYSFQKFSNDPDASFRVQLDSAVSIIDGVIDKTFYSYDSYGRLFVTQKPLYDDLVSISEMTYQVFDASVNIFDRPSMTSTRIESDTDIEWTKRSEKNWEYQNGEAVLTSSVVWPDASIDIQDGSQITKFKQINTLPNNGRDNYGNLLCWTGLENDTTSSKYSSDGKRLIASISHGFTNNVFLFNAEEDFDPTSNIGYDGWKNMNPTNNSITAEDAFTGQQSFKMINGQGLERILVADSVVRNTYILSFWAKSDGPVHGALSYTLVGQGSSMIPIKSEIHPADNKWHKLSVIVDLTDSQRTDLVDIKIGIRMDNSPSAIAYIDDVRFHPVDAIVSTTEIENETGKLKSTSGNNNIPIRKEVDEFFRPTVIKDFENKVLSKKEYFNSRMYSEKTESVSKTTPSAGNSTQLIKIPFDQIITYTLRLNMGNDGVEFEGKSSIRVNGVEVSPRGSIYYAGNGNHTETITHSISVNKGDDISISVWSFGQVVSLDMLASVDYIGEQLNDYDATRPSYIKNISYNSASDSSVSVSFSDGLGQKLQTRTLIEHNNQEAVLVSGFSSKNARGQVSKSYLSYVDSWNRTGLTEYEDSSTYIDEVNNYYDGVNDVDMEQFPFTEVDYENSIKSRPLKSASTGFDYRINSDHTNDINYIVKDIEGETYKISETIDQDRIKRVKRNHSKGKNSASISYYKKGIVEDSIITKYYSKLLDQISFTTFDTGTGEINLRTTYSNDRGQVDSTWKVDYGTSRMLYDKKGNLRFFQDTLHFIDNKFVYYKYDNLGRKIEEGVLGSASLMMTQLKANERDYPTSADQPVIAYRWYFDYYSSSLVVNPFDLDNPNVLSNPGKLVRLESGNGSYYKNFISKPLEHWDATIVKFPQLGISEKALRHYYNEYDESIKRFEVYPHFPDSSDARAINYNYDSNGRIKSIEEMPIDTLMDQLFTRKHAEYVYNANGSVNHILYGVYNSADSNSVVQKIDFTYDAQGKMIKINEPNLPYNAGGVVYDPEGGVTASSENDHFGQELTFFDATGGYYNGRIFKNKSVNSFSSTASTIHEYEYSYNDLSWLTKAIHKLDANNTRGYGYNALGTRDSIEFGEINPTFTKYFFDTNGDPGSSKLTRTSSMGTYPDISYDAAGNMKSDESRVLMYQNYDYRNMLIYSKIAPSGSGLYNSNLQFIYDESGNRIRKRFTYSYWEECDDPIDPPFELLQNSTMQIGNLEFGTTSLGSVNTLGSGGNQCPKTTYTETYYLYDGGVLIATFDRNDDVKDMFMKGTSASYSENDNAKLYYSLKDNLGSTRVVMHARENNTPIAVQANNYHPYGEILDSWTSIDNQFKFTGKEQDLHYNFDFTYFGARYYDTKLGRFTTLDRAAQFANGYSYVGNNPISLVDPDGNLVAPIVAVGVKVFGYYMTGKAIYNTGKTLYYFARNPSFSGLMQIGSSFGESYALSKIPGIKGVGIRTAWNKAAYGNWPSRDQIIKIGLDVAYYAADQFDEWRYRVNFRKNFGGEPEYNRRDWLQIENWLYAPPAPPATAEVLYADWFEFGTEEDKNRSYLWFYNNKAGYELGAVYKGPKLKDNYGDLIDPEEYSFIWEESEAYARVAEAILSGAPEAYDLEAVEAYWTNGSTGDLKQTKPFQDNQYYIINGSIYKSQDLGNIVFGAYAESQGKYLGTPWFKAGGGKAQFDREFNARGIYHPYDIIVPIGMVIWRVGAGNYGDDSRGAHYVQIGIDAGI